MISQIRQIKKIFNRRCFQITKAMWKNALFFIIFDFLNVFLPIFICLIAANLNACGAYATMGIGYVTSFQLAYTQIGLSFAIFANYYKLRKQKNQLDKPDNQLICNTLLIATIYGVFITPLYVIPAAVYTRFANAHINTVDSCLPAYQYIYSSSGFVLLITIACVLILNLKTNGKSLLALINMLFMFGMMILFSCTLGLLTSLKAIGLGLGLSIGTFLAIIGNVIHRLFRTHEFKFSFSSIRKSDLVNIVKYTWRPVIIVLSIQVLKGMALLSLNYQIPYELVNAVPLNYQMSRLLWYNFMYLIPFVTFGFTDSLYYFFVTHGDLKDDPDAKSAFTLTFFLCTLMTLLIIIMGMYLVHPIAQAYVKNQHHSYNANDPTLFKNIAESTREEIIKKINNSSFFSTEIKKELIDLLKTTFVDRLGLIGSYILEKFFVSFEATSIVNLLIFPHSFAYFYLGVYCTLYPLGQLLSAARMATRDKNPPALMLVFFQILAIIFIVQFGIKWQDTQRFWMMEAWSFPLAIIGVIAFIYMLTMYLITLHTPVNALIQDEQWNLKKQKIT